MAMFKQCRREFCCMLASCRGVPAALSDCTIAIMYYEGETRSHSGLYGPEALRCAAAHGGTPPYILKSSTDIL